jgi:oligopeptide transport system substrate-binding protein
VHLRYPVSENERRVAIALQSMWRAVFVEAELERAETAVHYASLQQGDFDLGLASWLAVYDDPQTFTLLLQTESGPNNLGGYSHPEYDRLADEASRQPSPQPRRAAARGRGARDARAGVDSALPPRGAQPGQPARLGWQDNMLDVNRSRYLGLEAD